MLVLSFLGGLAVPAMTITQRLVRLETQMTMMLAAVDALAGK